MNNKPPAWMRAAVMTLKSALDAVVGRLAALILQLLRRTDRKRSSDRLGALLRRIGPLLPEHRIGRANLTAAFPEKSPAEIDRILAGVWENLGRSAAEFAHLDRLQVLDFENSGPADVIYDKSSYDRFAELRKINKSCLFFAAHLANWEVPVLAATHYKVDTTVLYRRPNLGGISDAVVKMRAGCMGTLVPSGFDAPIRLANAIERGSHVGILVDQNYGKGVDVSFFGRSCKANPLIAELARRFDCQIRGIRVVRLPDGHRFWGEITDPIEPKRDPSGRVDVQGTMQVITSVVEEWVRQHPEQWLWLHRRWR
jgi:KDO2-lipid IV(A) lauroyltransferase